MNPFVKAFQVTAGVCCALAIAAASTAFLTGALWELTR